MAAQSSPHQLEFPDFYLPFDGKLSPRNRWVHLADLIPWDLIDERYKVGKKGPSNPTGVGGPAIPSRIAFGAMIIKEKLGCTDEETVAQIIENPYLQFFLGYTEMLRDIPFDPSMMVHFRKRFDETDYSEINLAVIMDDPDLKDKELVETDGCSSEIDDMEFEERLDPKDIEEEQCPEEEENAAASDDTSEENDGSEFKTNQGKLLIDASVTPADITYPTDLKLLNAVRVMLELIIDILHAPFKGIIPKPRTYRRVAQKEYLKITKLKRPGRKKIRKAIRKQLGYVKRDLEYIEQLIGQHGAQLSRLSKYQYRCLLAANSIYRQQLEMWKNKTNRIDHRIVSLSQPWVRPIVRGKQSAKVEFGAKISISVLADGYVTLDRMEWDAYNEGGDLIAQTEKYHDQFGYWPESVHADKIYLNRENRKWCKEKGIRLSGPTLGRPCKQTDENTEQLKAEAKQQAKDGLDRNAVEGKFGNCKRKGTLNRVMAKLQVTSLSVINIGLIVLNLDKRQAKLFCILLKWLPQRRAQYIEELLAYFDRARLLLKSSP